MKTYTLDMNKPLLGLDDQPVAGDTLNKHLAGVLAFSKSGPALQFTNWARDLFKSRTIVINISEREELLRAIRESGLQNIVRAQLEQTILEQAPLEPATPAA